MAISPVPAFPALSDRADGSYNSKAFAWASHMGGVFVTEANALAANLNSIAAGGAYAIPYTYNWKALVGTPAGGVLSHNDPFYLLNATDYLYLDLNSAAARSVAALINEMDDSTSTIRGKIRIEKQGDPTKWALFDVIGPSVHSANHSAIRVSWTAASSTPNPFTQGDQLILFFQRTGDKGDTGPAQNLPTMKIRDQRTAGTSPQSLTAGAWVTRDLNTTTWNDITGASLSGSVITLPAGSFLIDIVVPALGGGTHRARLYNISDSGAHDYGTPCRSFYGEVTTCSEIQTVVTLTTPKQFRVEHYLATGSSAGGLAVSDGNPEIYTTVRIAKIK